MKTMLFSSLIAMLFLLNPTYAQDDPVSSPETLAPETSIGAPSDQPEEFDRIDTETQSAALENDPEIRQEVVDRWENSSSEERRKFIQKNPGFRKALLGAKWETLTADEKVAFLKEHPALRKKLKKRWEEKTPEERQAFIEKHRRKAARVEERKEKREERRERRKQILDHKPY